MQGLKFISSLTIFLALAGCIAPTTGVTTAQVKQASSATSAYLSESQLIYGIDSNGSFRTTYFEDADLRRTAAVLPSVGNIRIPVFVVNFGSLSPNLSVTQARQAVFDGQPIDGFSVKSSLSRMSNNQLNISGDVYGVTINSVASDSLDQWMAKTKTAAGVQGYSESNYPSNSFAIYFFPQSALACAGNGTKGAAYILKYNEHAWLSSPFASTGSSHFYRVADEGMLLHEVGHALGFYHDNSYICMNSSKAEVGGVTDHCKSVEYGDQNSLMGSGENGSIYDNDEASGFPVPGGKWMAYAGWVSPTQVSTAGTYNLSPIDRPAVANTSQLLILPRTYASPGSSPTTPIVQSYYYIYQKTNSVPILSGPGGSVIGYSPPAISIQIANAPGFDQTQGGNGGGSGGSPGYFLRPMTIRFANNKNGVDQLLKAGGTFNDPVTGASITVNSIDSNKIAQLSITPGSPSGLPSMPVIVANTKVRADAIQLKVQPGIDGRGGRTHAFKVVVNGNNSTSKTYPYIACQSPSVGCNYEFLCESALLFVPNLTPGRTHRISIYSLDEMGGASPAKNLDVAM